VSTTFLIHNIVLMIIDFVTLNVSVTTKDVIPSTIVTKPCLKSRITNVSMYEGHS